MAVKDSNTRVCITLPKNNYETIKGICKRANISVSKFINFAVDRLICMELIKQEDK